MVQQKQKEIKNILRTKISPKSKNIEPHQNVTDFDK